MASEIAFEMQRLVHAPQAVVWQAYTALEPLLQWFGPSGFTVPHSSMDLRPGGIFHYCLRGPTGLEIWGKWDFVDLQEPEYLEVILGFSDAKGRLTRHPMEPTWPLQTLSRTTLRAQGEQGGSTEVAIRWEPWQATQAEIATFVAGHAAMQQGCNDTFAHLDAYLATRRRAA